MSRAPDPPRAALVATGDELVRGDTAEANCGWLARRLASVGIEVERFLVLGDDERELASSLVALCTRFPLVLVTGGLGPTLDDLTREAVARAAGVGLALDPGSLAELERWFARLDRPMSASNRRQAMLPTGAEPLPNSAGTAPGFTLLLGRARLFVLPGPPREMRAVFEERVLPRLAGTSAPDALARQDLHLVGLAESVFADRAGSWMERGADPLIGVSAGHGLLHVSLFSRGAGGAERVERRARELRERFAQHVYGEGDEERDLALVVGRELVRRRLTVAVAESCTGGLVSAALTRTPGISAVLERAWVVYSERAKEEELSVEPELLRAHGSVSAPVAAALARGAARASGARLALAVTGIAGPGGGSAAKPVGLVFLASCLDGEVEVLERRFPAAGREAVRAWAANALLGQAWMLARSTT